MLKRSVGSGSVESDGGGLVVVEMYVRAVNVSRVRRIRRQIAVVS